MTFTANDMSAKPTDYPAKLLNDIAQPGFSGFLDLARWIAASIVFLGHLRDPLFFGYDQLSPADMTILIKLWYFVTGWFGEAVIVFFVLSGYLVGAVGVAKLSIGEFNLANYAVDRVSRLFMAFLPALVLTAVLDGIGYWAFSGAGLYDHTQAMIAQKINSPPFFTMATLPNFFGNAVMLQHFYFETYGSNTPLWTISSEFWFYAVFGLAAVFWLPASRNARLIVAALILVVFGALGWEFLQYLGLWLIGLAIAFIPARRLEQPLLALAILLLTLIAFRLGHRYISASGYGLLLRNYGVALAFGYLLFSMRSVKTFLPAPLELANRWMADFSYSLYLIHFPLMIFLLSLLHDKAGFAEIRQGYAPTSHQGQAIHIGLIVAIYLLAWLFSLISERQTWRVRKWVKRRIFGRPATRAA